MVKAAMSPSSFDLLGKRWSALIVEDLLGGPKRFRELLTHVGRINDKVLSQRLKELEGRGLIQRQVFAEVPVRVEYTLTPKGRSLGNVIKEMEQWDVVWTNGSAQGAPGYGAVATAAAAPSGQLSVSPVSEPVAAEAFPRPRSSFWRRLGL